MGYHKMFIIYSPRTGSVIGYLHSDVPLHTLLTQYFKNASVTLLETPCTCNLGGDLSPPAITSSSQMDH